MAALTKADCEEMAVQVLLFLSSRPEDLERFCQLSGVEPGLLRRHIGDSGFQDGLLDYLLSNEPLLLAFCEETGVAPASMGRLAAQSGRMDDSWP